MSLSTWYSHSPCWRCVLNLPHEVCGIQVELSNMGCDQKNFGNHWCSLFELLHKTKRDFYHSIAFKLIHNIQLTILYTHFQTTHNIRLSPLKLESSRKIQMLKRDPRPWCHCFYWHGFLNWGSQVYPWSKQMWFVKCVCPAPSTVICAWFSCFLATCTHISHN